MPNNEEAHRQHSLDHFTIHPHMQPANIERGTDTTSRDDDSTIGSCRVVTQT